eukprot:CAMPEP_0172487666 /NCGR_PEP_ID=MMETSP1066-20121228/16835_1 /TAXON_ID=671091 /ORGANISM="Coscinodiscus wailesii, Strain CCMP2513" /LENGTH=146 /DNA_ID=CAMNT_0013254417 /DNA_START=180 /DNA_END=620 /DNA_ORIENTATION=-
MSPTSVPSLDSVKKQVSNAMSKSGAPAKIGAAVSSGRVGSVTVPLESKELFLTVSLSQQWSGPFPNALHFPSGTMSPRVKHLQQFSQLHAPDPILVSVVLSLSSPVQSMFPLQPLPIPLHENFPLQLPSPMNVPPTVACPIQEQEL